MKKGEFKMKHLKNTLVVLLLFAIVFSISSCSNSQSMVKANNLMDGINSSKVSERNIDNKFVDSTMNFSVDLFKKSITDDENSLVSPLSVLLALAMTTNGADNKTLEQMEHTLGGHDIALLNEYLYTYVKNLPTTSKSKLNIANSIWFRDDENRLTVQKMFLQNNADYYGAAAYKSPFDDSTVKDINRWVKENTDGVIEEIIDSIDEDTVMYLINAIVFDAEWEKIYNENDIRKDSFTTNAGKKKTVDFMFSEESLYIKDDNAHGFIKPYANNDYSFFALLSSQNIALKDYIQTLTGDKLYTILSEPNEGMVYASLPKFEYDYEISMNNALSDLGMPDAFIASKADFTKLGKSSRGNIYIGEVLHKSFISVDEKGTKAGAVTKVEIKDESFTEGVTIRLDRPFLYGIIDNSTNLPVFIGTVQDPLE